MSFHWLGVLVSPLNHVLFVIGADHVSWAELLGFVTGGACVWLTVRSNVVNFPVGIANSAFFLVLFTYASLWADATLQIVFIVLGFMGWRRWVRPAAGSGEPMIVRHAPSRMLLACTGSVVAATLLLWFVLRAANDSAPFWDALTTALSLAAQWLLNAKRVENWWFWIAADVIYVPLYFSKHLTLTGIVYVLFLAMCFAGLRDWIRLAKVKEPVAERVPA